MALRLFFVSQKRRRNCSSSDCLFVVLLPPSPPLPWCIKSTRGYVSHYMVSCCYSSSWLMSFLLSQCDVHRMEMGNQLKSIHRQKEGETSSSFSSNGRDGTRKIISPSVDTLMWHLGGHIMVTFLVAWITYPPTVQIER